MRKLILISQMMETMSRFLVIYTLLFLPLSGYQMDSIAIPSFIDPTGTYILKGEVKKNRLTGHSGEIRVRLLEKTRIALCFYINSGYPDYESGSFLDTLSYRDNQASYRPARDPQCSILFFFSRHKAEVQQLYNNPSSGCGFGKGVMASNVFEKYSGDEPVIQDLSQHGIQP
jgi:hypothetical protein